MNDYASSPQVGDRITIIGGALTGTTGIAVAVGTSDSRPTRTDIVFTTEAGWVPGDELAPGTTHKVPLSLVTWNIPAARAIRPDAPADTARPIPYRVAGAATGRPVCENSTRDLFGRSL